MSADPTFNDFLDWIRWHLDKALDRAQRAVGKVKAEAAAHGMLNSGQTAGLIFEAAHNEFQAGISTALGELKRAGQITRLDRIELRQHTVQCLAQFALTLKSITDANHWQCLGMGDFVGQQLAKFDTDLKFAIRQFDVGFLTPPEPERPTTMTDNSIKIGTMTGSAIQQGSSGATQIVSISVNVAAIKTALEAFESELARAQLAPAMASELTADVQTIRSQLMKSAPSHGVIQEAGNSIRKVLEGAATGAVTAGVVAAAKALYSTIGFG